MRGHGMGSLYYKRRIFTDFHRELLLQGNLYG
jgi:hypothetical protein